MKKTLTRLSAFIASTFLLQTASVAQNSAQRLNIPIPTLSTSPTITFSNSTGFLDNIAVDGEGGSIPISDIDIQTFPINSSGTLVTGSSLEFHSGSEGNWTGYPSIITYGGEFANYGWTIKSSTGNNFSLVSLSFLDWGGFTGENFVIEAYNNGSSLGSVVYAGNTTTSLVQLSNSNQLTSIFKNLDEVRIYKQDGKDFWGALNNIKVSSPVSTPTFSASATLASFQTCSGSASTPQTITVAGTDLTNNILVTAPAGYEVSTSQGSGYSSSLNLTPASGTVSTTVFVRMTSTATTSNGDILFTSTGAANHSLAVSGVVNDLPTKPIISSDAVAFCAGSSLVLKGNNLASAAKSCLTFDGVDDKVSVGSPIASNSSYTKEAWVYVTSTSGAAKNIISSLNTPLFISSGTLYAGQANAFTQVSSAGFPVNTWTHVAVTFDDQANTMKLYVNGVLKSTNSAVTSSYTSEVTYIGSHDGVNSFLAGNIDEVRIWNTAKTQAEIQNNMNVPVASNSSDLVAYYKFDGNTGLSALNSKTNTNDGTLVNGPTWATTSTAPVYNALWSNSSAFVNIVATNAGNYTLTTTDINGCSSVSDITTLAINQPSATSLTKTACGSYLFDGISRTTTGTYSANLTNKAGCDSIVTLNLTINKVNTIVELVGGTLNAVASTATYQWLDCDNNYSVIDGATDRFFTPTTTGNYAVIITENGCSDTSDCKNVSIVTSVSDSQTSTLSVYPNPATEVVNVTLPSSINGGVVSITDIHGNEIVSKSVSGLEFNISTSDLSSGVYILKVSSSTLTATKQIVVVK